MSPWRCFFPESWRDRRDGYIAGRRSPSGSRGRDSGSVCLRSNMSLLHSRCVEWEQFDAGKVPRCRRAAASRSSSHDEMTLPRRQTSAISAMFRTNRSSSGKSFESLLRRMSKPSAYACIKSLRSVRRRSGRRGCIAALGARIAFRAAWHTRDIAENPHFAGVFSRRSQHRPHHID
jgi:hypothetical protein